MRGEIGGFGDILLICVISSYSDDFLNGEKRPVPKATVHPAQDSAKHGREWNVPTESPAAATLQATLLGADTLGEHVFL